MERTDNESIIVREGSLGNIETLASRVNENKGRVGACLVNDTEGQNLLGNQIEKRTAVSVRVTVQVVILRGASKGVGEVQGLAVVSNLFRDLATSPGVKLLAGVSKRMGLVRVDVSIEVTTADSQVLADAVGLNTAGTVMDTRDRHPTQGLHEATSRETVGAAIIGGEITNVQMSTKEQDGLGRVNGTDGLDNGQGLGPTDRDVSNNQVDIHILLESLLEPWQGHSDIRALDDSVVGSADKVVEETVAHHTGTELHAELVIKLSDGDSLVRVTILDEDVRGQITLAPLGCKVLMGIGNRRQAGISDRKTRLVQRFYAMRRYLPCRCPRRSRSSKARGYR